MTTRLTLHAAAAADVEEAFDWYERARVGLGNEFLTAVRLTLDAVESHPSSFPVVYRGLRRALARRFPYAIYFRLAGEGEAIVVVACFHCSRSPRRWQRRT